MEFKIAVLKEDGIGPEVVDEAIKVLQTIGNKYNHIFHFEEAAVGATAIDQFGDPLPAKTLELCEQSDAVLFGSIGDPKYDNDPSAKVRPEQGLLRLRKGLGLYANIRPITTYASLLHKSTLKENVVKGVDFIIYRELLSGIYFGEKSKSTNGQSATDVCTYTVQEIEQIAHLAFKEAQKRQKRLTLIDKANVLETSRLWRERVQKLADTEYPDVTLDFLFVDNAAMQVILNPSQFDVILTENMFGDIISDEASVISGSIGLSASASIGEKTSLFEPIHGSYPQAKGKNIANPVAAILSAGLMLNHFNLTEEANAIKKSVERSLEKGIYTPDIEKNGATGTKEVGDFIVSQI
jgi:3-isopropylmalate dehydrogenase